MCSNSTLGSSEAVARPVASGTMFLMAGGSPAVRRGEEPLRASDPSTRDPGPGSPPAEITAARHGAEEDGLNWAII